MVNRPKDAAQMLRTRLERHLQENSECISHTGSSASILVQKCSGTSTIIIALFFPDAELEPTGLLQMLVRLTDSNLVDRKVNHLDHLDNKVVGTENLKKNGNNGVKTLVLRLHQCLEEARIRTKVRASDQVDVEDGVAIMAGEETTVGEDTRPKREVTKVCGEASMVKKEAKKEDPAINGANTKSTVERSYSSHKAFTPPTQPKLSS